jgi:hypothetical protein
MLGALGQKLNVKQTVAVKASIRKLQINEFNSRRTVTFWGKITGVEKDYLIVKSTTCTDTIEKEFYVSNDDGVTFAKLPEPDDFVREKSALIHQLFKGNLAQVYKDPSKVKPAGDDGEEEEEEEEEPEEEEGEEGAVAKPKERKLTELERLAWSVSSIENDCCIVPRGAYVLTPAGDITARPAAAWSDVEAANLGCYLLFRQPQLASTMQRIRKAGVCNNLDFLDQVEETTNSIRTEQGGQSVSIRSLLWPGAEFALSDSTFGSCYFGTGIMNHDLAFMV